MVGGDKLAASKSGADCVAGLARVVVPKSGDLQRPSPLQSPAQLEESTVGDKFHQTTHRRPTHRPPLCRDTRSTTGPTRKTSATGSGLKKRKACRKCKNTSPKRWASLKIASRRTCYFCHATVLSLQLPIHAVTNVKTDHKRSSASSRNGAFHRVAGPGPQLKWKPRSSNASSSCGN